MPANIIQNTDTGLATAVVNWNEPTASDNSGMVTVSSSHSTGEMFPIGVTTVTYTAVDAASNIITETFSITIEGNYLIVDCFIVFMILFIKLVEP